MEYDWLGFGYAALVATGGVVGYAKAGGCWWPRLSLCRSCPQAVPAQLPSAPPAPAPRRQRARKVPLSPCCHLAEVCRVS